jgi:hypothetical protein
LRLQTARNAARDHLLDVHDALPEGIHRQDIEDPTEYQGRFGNIVNSSDSEE